jgi:hypothetical protein
MLTWDNSVNAGQQDIMKLNMNFIIVLVFRKIGVYSRAMTYESPDCPGRRQNKSKNRIGIVKGMLKVVSSGRRSYVADPLPKMEGLTTV